MNYSRPLEAVGRGSKTQRQVGINLNFKTSYDLSHWYQVLIIVGAYVAER